MIGRDAQKNHYRSENCDYCGLPVPQPLWGRRKAVDRSKHDEPSYCCFGCRLAARITQESGETGAARWTLTRLGLGIFFSMNVMAFTMMLWSADVYEISQDAAPQFQGALLELFRYLCFLFSIPVLLLLGGPLLQNAWDGLRKGVLSVDLLLISGVLAAYAFSILSLVRETGHVYFEVGCMVLVMVTLGRWLEATGKLRAVNALDALQNLLPEKVRWIDGNNEALKPLDEVQIDDAIRVSAGERFPIDGVLVQGEATVDQQVFTGESWPISKQVNDAILGGTLNLDGDVVVRTTARADSGTLSRLVNVVKQARETKSRYEVAAERASYWFFPIATVISLSTFFYHWHISDAETGLNAALSVALIACPCALGLATPMAIWAALGRAAQEQIVFQNGSILEQLAVVDNMCFDKTGTLTTGTPRVLEWIVDQNTTRDKVMAYASGLAHKSTHYLSQAITQDVESDSSVNGQRTEFSSVQTLAGMGVWTEVDDKESRIALGNLRFMNQLGFHLDENLANQLEQADRQNRPLTYVGWNGTVQAAILFEESLRPGVSELLSDCVQREIDVTILTGDRNSSGQAMSDELQVTVKAELLPEDKMATIQQLQNKSHTVAMVGDGINDAPALACANIGIALGCGTDVSRESADVCILSSDLTRLPWLIDLAQQTRKTIRQNLTWAFGYNSVGICLAVSGYLYPAIAAVLMTVSSFLVITNSLRLSHYKKESTGFDGTALPTGKQNSQQNVNRIGQPSDPLIADSNREGTDWNNTEPIVAGHQETFS